MRVTRPRGIGRSVALLAAVVSLVGIDQGTLPVNAPALERAFHVSHAGIGLLASATTLTGALFILPVGGLTDRVNRVRLLAGSVLLWALAAGLSGAALGFGWLLAARIGLAAVTCTAGPTVASLLGDLAPSARRARLYSWLLIAETLGNGVGLLVSSALAAVSWRLSLAWPALPALVIAWLVARMPEPARGARSAHDQDDSEASGEPATAATRHPERVPLREALRYVLHTRTVIIMIIASSLGYFFFAGVHTFAFVFASQHYGLGRGAATGFTLMLGASALAGMALGGRVPDLLARRGVVAARVWWPAVAFLAAPLVLAPGIALTGFGVATPLLMLGTALLASANPPLDAARLDVIPGLMWGRAEAVRSALRSLGEAAAPALFGFTSTAIFHGPGGLTDTFLICLAPLAGAGALILWAARSYPADAARADRAGRVSAGRDDELSHRR